MNPLDNGFDIVHDFMSASDTDILIKHLETIPSIHHDIGMRHIEKKSSAIRHYIHSARVQQLVLRYLSHEPKLVRAIYFNKTAEKNWRVTWHQDKTVAVSETFNKKGWEPWSIKEGVLHVQPPVEVLNHTIAIRIHLDAATIDNGCLKILPNSHQFGIMSQEHIQEYTATNKALLCEVNKGAALVMRPHLLHASSKGRKPSQRRILHLEFSDYVLPSNIQWA